jgi:hypothetical protein
MHLSVKINVTFNLIANAQTTLLYLDFLLPSLNRMPVRRASLRLSQPQGELISHLVVEFRVVEIALQDY